MPAMLCKKGRRWKTEPQTFESSELRRGRIRALLPIIAESLARDPPRRSPQQSNKSVEEISIDASIRSLQQRVRVRYTACSDNSTSPHPDAHFVDCSRNPWVGRLLLRLRLRLLAFFLSCPRSFAMRRSAESHRFSSTIPRPSQDTLNPNSAARLCLQSARLPQVHPPTETLPLVPARSAGLCLGDDGAAGRRDGCSTPKRLLVGS
jgi:hypothetical protein